MKKPVITCTVMYKDSSQERKTIVNCNSSWDEYYQAWKSLNVLGWKSLIETKIDISDEVLQEINTGVYILDGNISAKEYIENNTSFCWKKKRPLLFDESMGFGKLPGHLGKFEKKN